MVWREDLRFVIIVLHPPILILVRADDLEEIIENADSAKEISFYSADLGDIVQISNLVARIVWKNYLGGLRGGECD